MRHANIVQILAVNRDNACKQHYIVMEFVEGGNLRDFLSIREKARRRPRPCALIDDATAGLAHAFSAA